VRVLAGNSAANCGGMDADFFRDFLDHHGLERVGAEIEIFALTRDDGLANAKNGVLALLDVLHQLDSGGETLFDVIADVAISSITDKQAAVSWAQAELGQVVFVEESDPLTVDFAEIDVGLDEAGFGLVVAKTRPGIKFLDDIKSSLDDFDRTVKSPRDFLQLVGLNLFQMLGDDLLCKRVLRIESFQLKEQAFAQIARTNTDRIEILNDSERVFEIIRGILSRLGQLFDGSGEIPVFVEVADDAFGNFFHCVGADRNTQLPHQMIAETARRRKKLLERRPLGDFAFLRLAAVATRIEILVEECADVEFVERIRFWLFRHFLGFGFQEGFVAVVVGLRRLFAELFENRVGYHLLVDHFAEFETVQGEDADHLDQARRQNLLLRNFQVEFESLPSHRSSCLFSPLCLF